ncbi:glycerate kinase [Mycolicibacterium neoaurum]|uniref:Glycerate kinase n=1 Tax=Mycolicibacterium neoaurum TaxID=1795 RepID=A0AAV2WLF6_MYCNE|nr:glycerate kinase [Mycolicibacterium neoaurum]CDQ45101.1 glycerate kinase [Mycolicibacterium neoaurum]
MTGLAVLIAPDCFGDTLTAVQAAQAIAAGWAAARPTDTLTLAPQSDGGPGFVEVLASRLGGLQAATVHGPLGGWVDAHWVRHGETAYIECAQACGLTLPAARQRLAGIELIAASDVEHPLLGPMGAAAVFGPQKGADAATVALLEQRLSDWAGHLGPGIAEQAGAGAAGGLGAALLALGGRREPGAAVIAEHTRLADDLAAADLIITGEGRFDDQSLHGKVVSALAGGARERDVPVLVLAGQVTLEPETLADAGIAAAHSVTDFAGSVQLAMDDAQAQLTGLARRTAADWPTRLGNSDRARYR